MRLIKPFVSCIVFVACLFVPGHAFAAEYKIDTEGAHAFIQFRIKHLGYSWLYGRFDQFEGKFSYDDKTAEQSKIFVEIEMASLNSAHAERDKHLRGDKFFNVSKFPKATFKSTSFVPDDKKGGVLTGDLTLKGVTKSISFPVEYVGGGADPWGGQRVGFTAKTEITLSDFNIEFFEPVAEVFLDIEGIKL